MPKDKLPQASQVRQEVQAKVRAARFEVTRLEAFMKERLDRGEDVEIVQVALKTAYLVLSHAERDEREFEAGSWGGVDYRTDADRADERAKVSNKFRALGVLARIFRP